MNLKWTRRSRKRLHLDLSSQLHNPVWWNRKVFGCASGILREDDVELLSPPSEPRLARWKQSFSAQIVCGVLQIYWYAKAMASLEDRRDVRFFQETVLCRDAGESMAELRCSNALAIRNFRNVRRENRKQYDMLV